MLPLIGTAEAPKVPPSPMPAAASVARMHRLIFSHSIHSGCVAKHHSLARYGTMMKPLRVFIRNQGNHFRVVYQRHYPNGVLEEVVLTRRFESEAGAQRHADDGLRAQRIYRALTPP